MKKKIITNKYSYEIRQFLFVHGVGHISRLKTAFKTSFNALSKLAVQVKIHKNKKVEEYNVGSIQFQI